MLKVFRVGFGALLLLKDVDLLLRFGASMPAVLGVPIVVLWALASIGIISGVLGRAAALTIVLLCAAVLAASGFALFNQHLYLIASIAAILAVNVEVTLLLKLQLTIVYGFAALAKINESFLSGTVLYTSVIQRPFWQAVVHDLPSYQFLMVLAVIVVLVEATLAVVLWIPRLRLIAAIIGAVFHSVMLVLMTHDPDSFVRLLVFGGLLVLLYLPFFSVGSGALRQREPKRGTVAVAA